MFERKLLYEKCQLEKAKEFFSQHEFAIAIIKWVKCNLSAT